MIANQPVFRDSSRYWICIVGMGAGGARLFSEFVERASENPKLAQSLGVLLLDGRQTTDFGRGVAWGNNQSDLFRANMRLDTLDLPRQVFEDIKTKIGISEKWDPKEVPEDIQFQVRKTIGECLHDEFCRNLEKAKNCGLPVEILNLNAISIAKHNRAYIVFTGDGTQHFVDYIVLALGNVPKRSMPELEGNPEYIANPWHWESFRSRIKGRRIGIVGLGPTAVDAMVVCAQEGASFVVGASRNGRLQFPRPRNVPVSLRHLARDQLEPFLSLRESVGEDEFDYQSMHSLLTREFQDADACSSYNEACRNHRLSPLQMLHQGLAHARDIAPWYSVMKALDEPTPYIWHRLSEKGKKEYRQKLESTHSNLSFGMAYNHAIRLIELMDQRKLVIRKLVKDGSVTENQDGSFRILCEDESYDLDMVINCTGIGSTVADYKTPLISSLISESLIEEHPHGGFYVDFESGRVIRSSMPSSSGNIYALAGSFTRGTHFLTNCLGQLFSSCRRTAFDILIRVGQSIPS